MNFWKFCSIAYHLVSLKGENSDARILIMHKQHSDILKVNPYVNVFPFNIEHGENSKFLLKKTLSCLFSITCCHIIPPWSLCMFIRLDLH